MFYYLIVMRKIRDCNLIGVSGQFFFVFVKMSLVVRKPDSGFPTRSDTNQAVQPQKRARGLKFQIKEVEGLYYRCSENKGADQLHGYREADLGHCF